MADRFYRVVTPKNPNTGHGTFLLALPPVPTIGRKRRSRRARGRRIEARRNTPYVGGRIWLASAGPGFRNCLLPKVIILDEIDGFDCGLTEEQVRDKIAIERERTQYRVRRSLGFL